MDEVGEGDNGDDLVELEDEEDEVDEEEESEEGLFDRRLVLAPTPRSEDEEDCDTSCWEPVDEGPFDDSLSICLATDNEEVGDEAGLVLAMFSLEQQAVVVCCCCRNRILLDTCPLLTPLKSSVLVDGGVGGGGAVLIADREVDKLLLR